MPLAVGTRLGPYEIISTLGAGGMGKCFAKSPCLGDTGVVTAKLWIKGTRDGVPFDRTLWFSDTYVRTKGGWKYVFGQASLPLPKEAN
jgi:hypothetical protein